MTSETLIYDPLSAVLLDEWLFFCNVMSMLCDCNNVFATMCCNQCFCNNVSVHNL